jgi:hypothetical protein
VFADYPDIGVDATNLYISANMFGGPSNPMSGSFVLTRVWVIPKAALVAEMASITVTVHGDPPNTFDVPSGGLGFTLRTPIRYDTGGAYHLVSSSNAVVTNSTRSIDIWNVDPSTRALTNPAPANVARQALAGPFGSPISIDAPQAGPGQAIDAIDTRTHNAVERGGVLWLSSTNFHPHPSPDHITAAWYKIDPSGTGVPTVLDGGEVGGPTGSDPDFFMPAIAVDAAGDPHLVMARVSATEFCGIAVTARDDDVDPAGTMQVPALVQPGNVSYERLDTFGRNRWGDYAGAAWDPDAGVIWGFHEYAFADPFGGGEGSGNEQWRGRLFSTTVSFPIELSVFRAE